MDGAQARENQRSVRVMWPASGTGGVRGSLVNEYGAARESLFLRRSVLLATGRRSRTSLTGRDRYCRPLKSSVAVVLRGPTFSSSVLIPPRRRYGSRRIPNHGLEADGTRYGRRKAIRGADPEVS